MDSCSARPERPCGASQQPVAPLHSDTLVFFATAVALLLAVWSVASGAISKLEESISKLEESTSEGFRLVHERMTRIEQNVDRMDSRLNMVSERLNTVNERLDTMDARLVRIETILLRIDARTDAGPTLASSSLSALTPPPARFTDVGAGG